METADAERLTAKLFAAFSYRQDKLTAAVYVEQIAKLPDAGQALRAVDLLIETQDRLPPVAKIREVYAALGHRPTFHELEEPSPTEEERAANLERAREMIGRMTKAMP